MLHTSDYVAAVYAPALSRAAALLSDRVKAGTLPPVARLALWGSLLAHLAERFVEGVSRVKKCSVPGRGLMMLDSGALWDATARASPLLPGCLARDKGHVDGYVSAFYFEAEADVLNWVAQVRSTMVVVIKP